MNVQHNNISKFRIQYIREMAYYSIYLNIFWQIEFLYKIWFQNFHTHYTHLKNADAIIQNQFSQINKCTWTRFSLKVTFLQFCVSQLCSIVYFLLNKTFWFGQNTVFSKSRNVFLENVQWFWLFSMKKVSYEWIFQIQ